MLSLPVAVRSSTLVRRLSGTFFFDTPPSTIEQTFLHCLIRGSVKNCPGFELIGYQACPYLENSLLFYNLL